MQMPIIDKEEKAFRDPYIFASDVKAITIDNVLVNLFMLMRNNGARIKLMLKSGKFHDIRSLKEYFMILERSIVYLAIQIIKKLLKVGLEVAL